MDCLMLCEDEAGEGRGTHGMCGHTARVERREASKEEEAGEGRGTARHVLTAGKILKMRRR